LEGLFVPFLAVCPNCQFSQVCVLPQGAFPRLKCQHCRAIYDPVGSDDTEVLPELAGTVAAKQIVQRRVLRSHLATLQKPARKKKKSEQIQVSAPAAARIPVESVFAEFPTTRLGRLQRPARATGRDAAIGLAWLSVICGGLSLMLVHLPNGWWIALAAASLGLVLGLRACRHVRPVPTVLVPVFNLVILAMLVLAPEWLGIAVH
jgi:hypothetical protein